MLKANQHSSIKELSTIGLTLLNIIYSHFGEVKKTHFITLNVKDMFGYHGHQENVSHAMDIQPPPHCKSHYDIEHAIKIQLCQFIEEVCEIARQAAY